MFKQNLKNFYSAAHHQRNQTKLLNTLSKRTPGFTNRQLSELYKQALTRNSRLLPQALTRTARPGTFLNRFMPKRSFNSNIDRMLENLLSRLPNGNIGFAIIFLNSFFYFLYLLWPRH